MLGMSAGAADAGSAMEASVWPSAGCLSASASPIVWMAPTLFSTMTRQPSLSPSSLAMMRPMMSGGVPAGLGTIMRTMLEG